MQFALGGGGWEDFEEESYFLFPISYLSEVGFGAQDFPRIILFFRELEILELVEYSTRPNNQPNVLGF